MKYFTATGTSPYEKIFELQYSIVKKILLEQN